MDTKNSGNTGDTDNNNWKEELSPEGRELLERDRERYPSEYDLFPCRKFGFFDVRELLHAFGIIGVFEGDEFILKLSNPPQRLTESLVVTPPYLPGVSICLLQAEVEDEEREGQQYHILFQHVLEEFLEKTLCILYGVSPGSFSVIVGEEQPRKLRTVLQEWLSHDEEPLVSPELFEHWARVREETDRLFPRKPKPPEAPQAE